MLLNFTFSVKHSFAKYLRNTTMQSPFVTGHTDFFLSSGISGSSLSQQRGFTWTFVRIKSLLNYTLLFSISDIIHKPPTCPQGFPQTLSLSPQQHSPNPLGCLMAIAVYDKDDPSRILFMPRRRLLAKSRQPTTCHRPLLGDFQWLPWSCPLSMSQSQRQMMEPI